MLAKALGCAYIPQHQMSPHGPKNSGYLLGSSVDLRLGYPYTCSAFSIPGVRELWASKEGCPKARSLATVRGNCNIITLFVAEESYETEMLHCLANDLREGWKIPSSEVNTSSLGTCTTYAAIHKRWGDVAGGTRALIRGAREHEIEETLTVAQLTYGITPQCCFVFAEDYPTQKIANVSRDHRVITDGTIFDVVTMLAGAKISFLSYSGMDLLPALLFRGSLMMVPRGARDRLCSLSRAGPFCQETTGLHEIGDN